MAVISFKGSSNELIMEEDYIDMEITSSNTLLPYSSSPPKPQQQSHANNNKEFEFQMSSSLVSADKDTQMSTTYFPADELFYNGKLLPLHLLQTPNKFNPTIKLSQQPQQEQEFEFEDETFSIPFTSLTAPCTNTNTPINQSCNISPSESCRVSCEFLSDEYLSEDHQCWSRSTQVRSVLIGGPNSSKKSLSSWSTKLRQSSLGKKLVKASRAYLKTFFVGSKTSSTTTCNVGHEENCLGPSKASTFGSKMISDTSLMKSIENEIMAENITTNHRKSFSGVIHRNNNNNNSNSSSGSSSSSSSFSLSSNGTSFSSSSSSYDLQWLKRCSSASLELESSIEGAIAHCKQSLKSQFNGRSKTTTTGQVGHIANFSLSSSRIAV